MLSCGCEVQAGKEQTLEDRKKHAQHTVEALLYWELLIVPGGARHDAKVQITKARLEIQKAFDVLAPGWAKVH